MNKTAFLKSLRKTIQISMLLVFVVFSG
ncbi:MAG TPA: cytochrome c, partial [Nitrospina sp.]|nr:cytochrome c [Nitrospina sp.]